MNLVYIDGFSLLINIFTYKAFQGATTIIMKSFIMINTFPKNVSGKTLVTENNRLHFMDKHTLVLVLVSL